MSIRDSMERWLPYPVYRFVGGPFDSQKRKVDLVETERGMLAPEVWSTADAPAPPPPMREMATSVFDEVVRAHRYRFVPDRGHMNQGHYEYIAE